MTRKFDEKYLNLEDLGGKLAANVVISGSCLGYMNIENDYKEWHFLVYLGDKKFLNLYDNCLIGNSIEYLKSIVKNDLSETDRKNVKCLLITFDQLKPGSEFFIYKLNIYKETQEETLNFLKTLEQNLEETKRLEEGDAIIFKRVSFISDEAMYYHAGILVDKSEMVLIHRIVTDTEGLSLSDLVLHTHNVDECFENAVIKYDHLFEIAADSFFFKGNDKFLDSTSPKRSIDEVLENAKGRIGERGYSILEKNCQHFVSECLSGQSISFDAQRLLDSGFKAEIDPTDLTIDDLTPVADNLGIPTSFIEENYKAALIAQNLE